MRLSRSDLRPKDRRPLSPPVATPPFSAGEVSLVREEGHNLASPARGSLSSRELLTFPTTPRALDRSPRTDEDHPPSLSPSVPAPSRPPRSRTTFGFLVDVAFGAFVPAGLHLTLLAAAPASDRPAVATVALAAALLACYCRAVRALSTLALVARGALAGGVLGALAACAALRAGGAL